MPPFLPCILCYIVSALAHISGVSYCAVSHTAFSLLSTFFSYSSLSFGCPCFPFRVRIHVSIVRPCSFLFLNQSSQLLSEFLLQTSAFSFLSCLPVTVTEPETVIGKIPSEHKRMTFTHVPRVKFSNNLRFPSPLSCSESVSFRLSVYLSSLRFF